MAESSLSIGLPELQREVARFLSYSLDSTKRTERAEQDLDDVIQSGVRQFYYPPVVDNDSPHRWSFLQPTVDLTMTADDNEIILPDDFQAPVGEIRFNSDVDRFTVRQVSETLIRSKLATFSSVVAPPELYAIVWDASDGSSGQRARLLFYPVPDADRTLSLTYEAYQGKLDDTHPYPLGGMMFAELIKESCLAVAEQRMEGEKGLHWETFFQNLKGMVQRDSQRKARYFGRMDEGRGSLGYMGGDGDGYYRSRTTSDVYYDGNLV